LTDGEHDLAYLRACIRWLDAADNELLAAIAGVLHSFDDDYETEDDVPECPSCDGGYCRGHDLQTFHVRCGDLVQQCSCLAPYLELAGRATKGVTMLA
jgi:hypothetical protein